MHFAEERGGFRFRQVGGLRGGMAVIGGGAAQRA